MSMKPYNLRRDKNYRKNYDRFIFLLYFRL